MGPHRPAYTAALAADALSTGSAGEKLFPRPRGVGRGKISICLRGGKWPGEGLTTAWLPLCTAEGELGAFDPIQQAMGKLGVKAQPQVWACFPQPQEAPEPIAPHEGSSDQILLQGCQGLSEAGRVQPSPWGRLLTARSSMSIVTASSASTCTVESAWTVTEPLLTAKAQQRGLSQAAQAGLPDGPLLGVNTHWQAHPWNLHHAFAKTKLRLLPVTLPRSHRDSFPTEREAEAEDAPRV